MSFEFPETDSIRIRLLKGRYMSSIIMDTGARKNVNPSMAEGKRIDYNRGKIMEYQRSLSHGNARKLLPASYFSLESLLLLICLTASLLILPLILPPLPPPPFLLLLIPIGILVLLMILAFMPSNVRDMTHTYA